MGIWNGKPKNGSLWVAGGDQAPSGRKDKHDQAIAEHRERVAKAEERRLAEEERDRQKSRGKHYHPGSTGHGHKEPWQMTPREQRAHGIKVTRGLFGSYHVAALDLHQEKEQAAREEKRRRQRERKETRGGGGFFSFSSSPKKTPKKKKGFFDF